MKFSENWLREWVNPELDSEQLAARLTMAGLEVDALVPVAKAFTNVVVGEVLATEKHPDADKLNVCRVSDGQDEFQVVCGAPNVRPGLRVPFARVGATLGADFKIKQARLRGVESSGMLCSADELGLAEDADGLLELPADAPVGAAVVDYLGLNDNTIEIGLTPNRGDCLGIVGVARDVATITGASLQHVGSQATVAAEIDDALTIELRAPESCPRYVGRVIRGVDLSQPSPLWLQEKLRRSDIRSIDPVVDVTNYVLMELGQPMHAFDLGKIEGGIVVRMAEAGERLTLLDDSEVTLSAEHLVIADHAKGLALAGIMGGACSAVGADTCDIFLESAFFAPQPMAGKARAFGMHTDACHRYERGVDFELQSRAMERATELLLTIVGGQAGPAVAAVAEAHLPELPCITLRRARLDAVLGVSVPDSEVERILNSLGARVSACDAGWQAVPPSWRFDIRIEADLCEEIARVFGYERIPTRVQPAAVPLRAQPEAALRLSQLRRRLTTLGYQEAITYSFVEPALQQLLDPEREPVPVANPISSDMAVMRTTLLAGLVKAVQFNQHRQQRRVRLFESGLRFVRDDNGLLQRMGLAGIATGDRMPEGWSASAQMIDFFDIKGDLELVLGVSDGNVDYQYEPVEHPALHPGQAAALWRDGKQVGILGALHPSVVDALDLVGPVYVFEVDLAHSSERNLPKFKALSKFPEVRRDIAVVVAEDVSVDLLLKAANSVVGAAVKDLNVFDIYRGQGVDSDSKSVAISVHLQHAERTLNDEEVNGEIATIVAALERECGAVLRE